MEADSKAIVLFFYVFVLNYSTVKCCFFKNYYFTLVCLSLNATESPIGDPGSVGGLHHACRVDLVAVETGKVISCAVVPECRLTERLVTE